MIVGSIIVRDKRDPCRLHVGLCALSALLCISHICSQKNQTQAEQKQREQKQGEKKQAEQKLVHSIDNVNAFAKLNIELPMTASKVPATLDAIKACKEHFLAERAKVYPCPSQ